MNGSFFPALILFIALPVWGNCAEYPTDKGAIDLSADFSYLTRTGVIYEDDKGETESVFMLGFNLGIFIKSQWAVGGMVSYNSLNQGNNTYKEVDIGPRLDKYFGGKDSKVLPFVSGAILIHSRAISGIDLKGSSFLLGGGLALPLEEHYMMKVGLNFNFDNEKEEVKFRKVDREYGRRTNLYIGFSGFMY